MNLVLLIILVVIGLLLAAGAAFALRGRRTRELAPAAKTAPPADAPPLEKQLDSTSPSDVDGSPKADTSDDGPVGDAQPGDASIVDEPVDEPPIKPTFRERLGKARTGFSSALGGLRGRKVDEEAWEELEEALIRADVGVPTTMAMLERVRARTRDEKVTDFDGALMLLRQEMETQLEGTDISLTQAGDPAVWLFVGVNGVGKTTTIGKLANRETVAGSKVVLAAGDTFRAAAAEQLETWAERAGTGFIRGAEGADPGSVIFDAVEHAAASGADLVLADTAGRLHNKSNLMEELAKVRRVAEKASGQVTEVLLVIDATTGQNGLAQAKQFTESVDVTGIVLTKLDGSAKGGIVLAIQSELGIPVKLVGLGEGIEDLVEFDSTEFVDALFA